jgi:sulfonate transport system substrate-binding protein
MSSGPALLVKDLPGTTGRGPVPDPPGAGDAPPAFAAAAGDQIAIVGALRGNPLAAAVVVPKNSPIHSVAALRGKKIAVADGSSGDYSAGLIRAKVDFANFSDPAFNSAVGGSS